MESHLLLFTIDIVAIVSMAFFGANFILSQPRNVNALLWAFISFNTVCYLLFSRYTLSDLIPHSYQVDLGSLAIPIWIAINLTPGLFTILAFSLFQDGQKFPRWLYVVFIVQVFLEEPVLQILHLNLIERDYLLKSVPAILQIILTIFAIYWTVNNCREDLVEERRRLRMIFLLITGIYIITSVVLGRILATMQIVSPIISHMSLNLVCALLGIAGVFAMFRSGNHPFTEPGRPAPPETKTAEIDRNRRDLEAIEEAFQKQHVYREGGLTVGSLAAKLAIPEYRVRRVIHQNLDYRNFNALVHDFRIKEASEYLASADNRNVPILTIALTVGYQSVNPFNRAFRELKGMSPSEFRAQALAEPSEQ